MAAIRRTDIQQTADGLHRLLDAIAAGELSAASAAIARLEGALAALHAVIEQHPDDTAGATGPAS